MLEEARDVGNGVVFAVAVQNGRPVVAVPVTFSSARDGFWWAVKAQGARGARQ